MVIVNINNTNVIAISYIAVIIMVVVIITIFVTGIVLVFIAFIDERFFNHKQIIETQSISFIFDSFHKHDFCANVKFC
ncbi:hypothetical protein NW754_014995 [Fusarium falciforme]|nr:hypothetical protein NW754_014995 [Fusarium falciforme]